MSSDEPAQAEIEEVNIEVPPDTPASKKTPSLDPAAEKKKHHKKELRDKFLLDDFVEEEDEEERHVKLEKAKVELVKSGCSYFDPADSTHKLKSLRTTPHELGQYGVGLQLYFEFLWSLGIVFSIMTVLSWPGLYYMLMGSFVEDVPETASEGMSNKMNAWFTAANLGACGDAECLTFEQITNRRVFKDSDDLLRDTTPMLAAFDFLQVLIFCGFCFWFKFYHVPKVARIQDEAHVTASDFAVEVDCLPRKLSDEDHPKYAEHLKEHFIQVLKKHDVPEEQCIVPEVALIREYDGCISKFMEQGKLLELMNEHRVKLRKAKKEAKQKEVDKHTKKVDEYRKKIVALEESLEKQGAMEDEQREVCGAFIMFETEQLKTKILSLYAAGATSYAARYVQNPDLQFRECKLIVKQACEPTDLYWENLDYSYVFHKLRKALTLSVSWLLLLFSVLLINFFRSEGGLVDTSSQAFDMWIFEGQKTGGREPCLPLCELKLSADPQCIGNMRDDIGSLIYNGAIHSVSGHALFDGDAECSTATWSSSSCSSSPSSTDSGDSEWNTGIALLLNEPQAVKCLQISAEKPSGRSANSPPKPLTVIGCNKKDQSPGDLDVTKCVRFNDVVMESFEREQPVRLRDDCLYDISLEAAQFAKESGEDTVTGHRISCFCEKASQEEGGWKIRIPGYDDEPASKVCYDWASAAASKMIFKYIAILVVLSLNNVLLMVFSYLDALGRYRTATDLANSQMYNLFVAELVNTAVVYLLVGVNTHGWGENSLLGALRLGDGGFDDLSGSWFISVGFNLFITVLCQIGCTVAFPAAWVRIVDPLIRWFFVRGVESQELLDEYHILPHFLLSLRVAETMVAVFCCFVYSAGFPLLLPVGVFYCFASYWSDKYALLRGSRKPPGMTKNAITGAVWLCPFAAFFHCVFSLWLFGQQVMFPSDWSGLSDLSSSLLGLPMEVYEDVTYISINSGTDVKGELYPEFLKARMMDMVRLAPVSIFIIFMAMLIRYSIGLIFAIFRPCLGAVEDALAARGEAFLKATGIQKDAKDTAETYTQAKARVEAEGKAQLMSYQLWENPSYEEAVEALSFNPSEEAKAAHGSAQQAGTSGGFFASFGAAAEGMSSKLNGSTTSFMESTAQAVKRDDEPKDNANVTSTQGPEAVNRVDV